MSRSIVKRIECVYLPAIDTQKSAEWYSHYLGLALLRPINEGQAQLSINPEQSMFLIKTMEPVNLNYIEGVDGNEQCILTMEVDGFDELHQTMKQDGARISDIEDNEGCGRNFFAYDPAGNKIDIWSGWSK